jgi:hypothetical protein
MPMRKQRPTREVRRKRRGGDVGHGRALGQQDAKGKLARGGDGVEK